MKDVEVYFWAPGLGAGACDDVIDYRANYRVELADDWPESWEARPRLISAEPVVVTEGPIEPIPVGIPGLLWVVRDGRCLDLIPAVATYKTGADTRPGEIRFNSLGEFVVTSEGPMRGRPCAARVEIAYGMGPLREVAEAMMDGSPDICSRYWPVLFHIPEGAVVTRIKVRRVDDGDVASGPSSAPGPDASWRDRDAML